MHLYIRGGIYYSEGDPSKFHILWHRGHALAGLNCLAFSFRPSMHGCSMPELFTAQPNVVLGTEAAVNLRLQESGVQQRSNQASAEAYYD